MIWTNFQPWHAIFSYLNKSLLSSILFLPMPDPHHLISTLFYVAQN
jgi:hypothetical protein